MNGHATFVLEDDTGSLPVGVVGSCLPQAASLLPRNGDEVVLNAVIHLSSDPGELPVMVWARAIEIRLAQRHNVRSLNQDTVPSLR